MEGGLRHSQGDNPNSDANAALGCRRRGKFCTIQVEQKSYSVAFEAYWQRLEPLKRDEFRRNRHRALAPCLGMIFSENRFTLFRIMP